MRPEALAVEAEDGALTYAELHARAAAGAASLGGAQRVAIALPPGLDFAVALHACLLAGAAAVPVDLREPTPRLAGATIVIDAPLPRITAAPPAAAPISPPAAAPPAAAPISPPAAAPAAARRLAVRGRARARPLRAGPRRPHLRHHRHAAAGRAHARSDSPQRARLRRRARPRSRRALALPAAAEPRGRADGAAAVGDLRDDRGARAGRPRGRDDRVARPDPARAADRPSAAADPARRDAGRRARRSDAARPRPRRRLAGRAHLRAHPGVLGGDGGRCGRHRDLRPSAARSRRRDRRRRRDPRRHARPGAWRRGTSAGSTSAGGWSCSGARSTRSSAAART